MSGDQLDLDEVEARQVKAGQCEAFDPYGNLTALVCEDVPALVAEVRRLRAKVERVEALLKAWDEIPDYQPSHYDRGRVDQRHMAAEELATVLGSPDAP